MGDPGEAIFSATADQRLFVQKGYHVLELDWNTGDTLWQYQYASEYLTGKLFIPGTANFIVHGNDQLFLYEMDTTGTLIYNLKATIPFDTYAYDFRATNRGVFYTRNGGQFPKLYRIAMNLSAIKEFNVTKYPQDYTPTEDGVVMLVRQPNSTFDLILKDSNGQDSIIFSNPNIELMPYYIKSNSRGISVTGQYTAGPRNASATYSTQGWLRYYPAYSLIQHQQQFSVSITDLHQRTAVDVDSTFYDYPSFMGWLHDFSGGDFEMEVTNTGDQPVDSFWINTRFQNAWFIWFCGLDMCKNILYQNHLDPGESVWVDFGDIYAINQYSLPAQFCFWTSGPNSRPDDLPADDTKCVDRIVAINDPPKPLFTIYPQPASGEIIISNIPDINDAIRLTIYSMDGEVRKMERLEPHQPNYQVNIADLPNGFYALKIGERIQPLVIVNTN
jgi:hypothetical protein